MKTALFTVVMPGTFAILVPILVGGDRTAASGATLVFALVLLVLGIVVYLRCAWDFVMLGRGTPSLIDAPKHLVTRGLYSYTRNPMYLAVLTVVVGWAILFGSAILAAYAVIIFVVFSLFIRFHEEPRLSREFGSEYAAYMAKVGRWLPRWPRAPRT